MQPGRPHPEPPQALQPIMPASAPMPPDPGPHPPPHEPFLQPPIANPPLLQPPVEQLPVEQLDEPAIEPHPPEEQPPLLEQVAQPVNANMRPASDPISSQRFIAESFPACVSLSSTHGCFEM